MPVAKYGGTAILSIMLWGAMMPDPEPVMPAPVINITQPGSMEGEAFGQYVEENDEFLPGLMMPTTRDYWERWREASHDASD